MATKHVLSAILIMVILSASIYLVFDDNVKINIEKTRTQYFVMEDNSWTLAATEYVNLYDGTTKMRAKSRDVSYYNDSEFYSVIRTSIWKDNITTIQTYKFSKGVEDITQFPLENNFECINCQGKIVHYEIRDILYNGVTEKIKSTFSFGHNMNILWEDGAYYSKVFQQKVASDKIIIKYRPDSGYESYSVRLFDPPSSTVDDVFKKLIYNEAGLTGGESIFEIYNPTNYTLDKSKIDFVFEKKRGNNIDSYDIFINYSKGTEIQNYSVKFIDKTCDIFNNKTNKIDVVDCSYNSTYRNGSYFVYQEDYKNLESIPPGYSKIKMKAYWKPHLGRQELDWIAEITLDKNIIGTSKDLKLKASKWAWFNTSWENKRLINITDPLSTDENRTQGFSEIISGLQVINCTKEIRIVDNDITEVPSYAEHINSTACRVFFTVQKLATESEKLYYIYYNNPSASAPSYSTGLSYSSNRVVNDDYAIDMVNGDPGADIAGDASITGLSSEWDKTPMYSESNDQGVRTVTVLINNPIVVKLSVSTAGIAMNYTFYHNVSFWKVDNFINFNPGDSGFSYLGDVGTGINKCINYRTGDNTYTENCGELIAATLSVASWFDFGTFGDSSRLFSMIREKNAVTTSTKNMKIYLRDNQVNDPQLSYPGSDFNNDNGSVDNWNWSYQGKIADDDIQREAIFNILWTPFAFAIYPEQSENNINVILNFPADDSLFSTNSIDFNCSASFDTGILNLTLIVDDVFNTTIFNSTAIENLSLETNLNIDHGNHNWACQGCTNSSCLTPDNRDFSVDTLPPDVTINSPLSQVYTTTSIFFNVTALDDNPNSCLYSLDNGVNNYSMTQSGDDWTETNSSMTRGIHTAIFYCNDTLGNLNNSEFVIFEVNLSFINITFPIDESNIDGSYHNITYTYQNVTTAGDCFYTNDSGTTNNTIICGDIIGPLNWLEGINNITVYGTDLNITRNSTWNESDLIISGGVTELCGNYYYENIVINESATINICDYNGIGLNGTLSLNAVSNFTLTSGSTINGNGKGFRGSTTINIHSGSGRRSGNDGEGPGPGRGAFVDSNDIFGAAGASFGGIGGFGAYIDFPSRALSETYGNLTNESIFMGSGGGSGSYKSSFSNGFAGGDGGGAIKIYASNISIFGTVNIDGLNGENSGTAAIVAAAGSGGSGGSLNLFGDSVNISSSTITAIGGSGGDKGNDVGTKCGGGGAGGGRIKVFTNSLSNIGSTIQVTGGSGGLSTASCETGAASASGDSGSINYNTSGFVEDNTINIIISTIFSDSVEFTTLITPPNVDYGINTLSNNTFLNKSSFDVDLIIELDNEFKNTSYFLFNNTFDLVNETIFTSYANAQNGVTFNTSYYSGDGVYYYNTTTYNIFDYLNATETRKITIDTLFPLINYTSNSDITNITADFGTKDNIFVNVSVTEINEANITFYLYTGFGQINTTTFTDGTRTINWTDLPIALYFWNVTICDLASNCNTTDERAYGFDVTNLTLELNASNLDAELGGDIDVNATSSFGIVCVDVNHPDYGVNASCGVFTTDFSLIIDYFRKNIFNDSTTSKVLDYVGEQVKNVFFPSHQYDEVDGFSFNITGVDESGYPENVLINKSNSSEVDRFFPGLLIGSNIFLDKDENDNESESLFYSGPGIKIIRFFIDDGANLISAYVNISGFKFGDTYNDEFNDESILDPILNEGLFRGGYALPKGDNLKEFVYDPFIASGDLDDSLWTSNASGSYFVCGGELQVDECQVDDNFIIDISNGYSTGEMFLSSEFLTQVLDGNSESETVSNFAFANESKFNIWTTQEIHLELEYDIDASESQSDGRCRGNSEIWAGGVRLWQSPWQHCFDEAPSSCTEGSRDLGGLKMNISRTTNDTWKVSLEGSEQSFGSDSDEGDCGAFTFTYDYDANTLTKTYALQGGACGFTNSVEFLASEYYYSGLNYDTNENFKINQFNRGFWSDVTGAGCFEIISSFRITLINQSLYNLSNSSIISEPVIETASDIISATFDVDFVDRNNDDDTLTLYLSANGGVDWEEVVDEIEHTFIISGTELKYRMDYFLGTEGYSTDTIFADSLTITTPEGFPSNITIDFGDDGIIDGTFDGELNLTNSPVTINISSANLVGALNESPELYDHLINVPMSIHSDTVGQINVSDFKITYNPNPISLNVSAIFDYIFSFFVFGDFPISIWSSNGNITVDDVRFDYAGGNSTFEVLAHNQDYTKNSSLNITYFYSSWDYEFVPNGVEWIYFAPKNSSDKNVEPYGQTNNTAIINITNYGYGGRNATLSIYENDINPCVNTTLSTTNKKSDGVVLIQNWTDIVNMSYLDSTEIYLFADYSCNDNTWAFYDPDYYFRLSCTNCISSEDLI